MATANKSLKFFMRPQEEQIVTFTGPESFISSFSSSERRAGFSS